MGIYTKNIQPSLTPPFNTVCLFIHVNDFCRKVISVAKNLLFFHLCYSILNQHENMANIFWVFSFQEKLANCCVTPFPNEMPFPCNAFIANSQRDQDHMEICVFEQMQLHIHDMALTFLTHIAMAEIEKFLGSRKLSPFTFTIFLHSLRRQVICT